MNEASKMPKVIGRRARPDEVQVDLEIFPELYWFQGHFPGAPVLAGVVQIDWVWVFARAYLGLDIPVARRFQVKFHSPIVPGDLLTLSLVLQSNKNRLSFEYRRGGMVCSSGQIKLIAP